MVLVSAYDLIVINVGKDLSGKLLVFRLFIDKDISA